MTTGDIQEGVQIAQVAAPIIEQLVTFLVGLFKKHAPAATPDQIEKGTTVAAHEVLTSIADASGNEVPQVAHVVAAVQTAIAAPAPEPNVIHLVAAPFPAPAAMTLEEARAMVAEADGPPVAPKIPAIGKIFDGR